MFIACDGHKLNEEMDGQIVAKNGWNNSYFCVFSTYKCAAGGTWMWCDDNCHFKPYFLKGNFTRGSNFFSLFVDISNFDNEDDEDPRWVCCSIIYVVDPKLMVMSRERLKWMFCCCCCIVWHGPELDHSLMKTMRRTTLRSGIADYVIFLTTL
jgi:hypothetical protein